MRAALLLIAAACLAGCPRLDAFACGDGGTCDLAAGGACVDGWCAYPDDECEGLRWHGDAPGVGGMCVPVEPGTTGEVSTTSSSSSSSSSGSESGLPSCGGSLPVRVDTMALAGETVLEGYPLIVALTDSALVDAEAVWWTDGDGAPLAYELEAFDPESGDVRAWVQLPAWTAGEALDLSLRFGPADLAPDNDPTAVWPEGFVAVLHLDDPLTRSADDLQLDSTANGEDATEAGTKTADQIVPGIVGPGVAFTGVAEDAVQFVGNSFVGTLDSITVTIWGRVDSDGTIENPFFERINGDNLMPRCRIRPDKDGALQCQTHVNEMTFALRADASLVPRGEWHHAGITYDASTGRFALYTNGEFIEEHMFEALPQGSGNYVPQIGQIDEFGPLIGVLDEFRIVDHPLSAEWIIADARSQRDPSSISSINGPAEPIECP